jgi:hypothetical protein
LHAGDAEKVYVVLYTCVDDNRWLQGIDIDEWQMYNKAYTF